MASPTDNTVLKDAHLYPIELGGRVNVFQIRQYLNSQTVSTYLIFSPAGITLAGDLTPDRRCNHAPHRDMAWFRADTTPYHLAENFLDKEWIPSRAIEHYQAVLADLKADALSDHEGEEDAEQLEWMAAGETFETDIDALEYLLLAAQERFETPEDLLDSLPAFRPMGSSGNFEPAYEAEDLGGYDYPEDKVALLVAIQKTFQSEVGLYPAPHMGAKGQIYLIEAVTPEGRKPLKYVIEDSPADLLDEIRLSHADFEAKFDLVARRISPIEAAVAAWEEPVSLKLMKVTDGPSEWFLYTLADQNRPDHHEKLAIQYACGITGKGASQLRAIETQIDPANAEIAELQRWMRHPVLNLFVAFHVQMADLDGRWRTD